MQPQSIKQRIENTRQIESIIVAMRAIAAAHLQEARKHVDAIRNHERSVAKALSSALAWIGNGSKTEEPEQGMQVGVKIVVGASQGFCGLFNETTVDAAIGAENSNGAATEYMVVGQRCVAEFDARGKKPALAFNHAARSQDIPRIASLIADSLYERIGAGGVSHVGIVHADPDRGEVTVKKLVPFDYAGLGQTSMKERPILQLPPAELLEDLVQEFIFSEICEALMLGFAAENNARMHAMLRARTNLSRIIGELEQQYNRSRQEKTTAEILELSQS